MVSKTIKMLGLLGLYLLIKLQIMELSNPSADYSLTI